MTLLLAAALLTASAFAAGYVAGRWRWRSEPLTLEKVRHAVDLRVAVHEAGHAVVAWHNPYVSGIDSVEMDEGTGRGNGRVFHRAVSRRSEVVPARWHAAAVCLGGIAAEMVELGKTRSGNCIGDLEKARSAARDVIADGGDAAEPPWEGDYPEDGAFDPSRMFREGSVTPEEARVLRIGYARARGVILRDRERFSRLAHDLMEKGVLREHDVRAVLGARLPRL